MAGHLKPSLDASGNGREQVAISWLPRLFDKRGLSEPS